MKEFFELAAKDKAVQEELQKASLEALKVLVTEKGFKDEAQKVLVEAATKVAEAHGFKSEMEELDLDELKAVAGGNIDPVLGDDREPLIVGYSCTGVFAHVLCDIVTF